jgi:hypothetical protein
MINDELEFEYDTAEDYYVCNDDVFSDKKIVRSFHEWEELFYKTYFPNCERTYKSYLLFLEWHYRYLSYRYTK